MPLQSFQPGIARSHSKLLQLRQALSGIANPEERGAAEEAVEEFSTALEELRVADEELRRQNDELAASQEMTEAERARYLELFLSAPMAFMVMDAAGVIREANLAAEELLGHERGFLAGKPLSVFFRERDTGNLRDQMCRAGAEQRSRVWSAWLHARGRENPVPVSITLVPIIDRRASAVTGFRLMLQDLTEMMAVRDHVRDLEDGLLRRVTERTMRLTEEVERLKQMVARYVERHGPLAEEEQSAPFAEPKVGAPGGYFAGGGGTKIEGSGETEYFWRVGTDSTADGETRR